MFDVVLAGSVLGNEVEAGDVSDLLSKADIDAECWLRRASMAPRRCERADWATGPSSLSKLSHLMFKEAVLNWHPYSCGSVSV